MAYAGDDLDAWSKAMAPYLPAWAIFDYRLMYDMFQKKGLKATPGAARGDEDDRGPRAAALRGLREGVRGAVG